MLQPAGSDQTDDRGQFRIYDIPPGTYYLMATPRVFGITDESRAVYPPIYFPGVLDPQEAAKIKMVSGGELRGYDLTLFETTGYQISARSLRPTGSRRGVCLSSRTRCLPPAWHAALLPRKAPERRVNSPCAADSGNLSPGCSGTARGPVPDGKHGC